MGVDNEFSTAGASYDIKPKYGYSTASNIDTESNTSAGIAAEPFVQFMSEEDLAKAAEQIRKKMIEAAKNMDFIEAARLRDELLKLEDSDN